MRETLNHHLVIWLILNVYFILLPPFDVAPVVYILSTAALSLLGVIAHMVILIATYMHDDRRRRQIKDPSRPE